MHILLTGANGFLGKTIERALGENHIVTLSRKGSQINVDLSKQVPQIPPVDLVIHCAGKAHSVPTTQAEIQGFFEVNVTGVKNLLISISNSEALPKAFVLISTVAVYGMESGMLIKESAPLLAKDPYGFSKIQAEKLVQSWCKENNVRCTILRLPLLAGPNPPGNLGAMIKAISKGYYFDIAGGKAKKSILLTNDVAGIIMEAAKRGGIYNLTDRRNPSFSALSLCIAKQLNKPKPANMPILLAKILAKFGDLLGNKAPLNSAKLNKITSDLTFDDSEAVKNLEWNPTPVLEGLKIK